MRPPLTANVLLALLAGACTSPNHAVQEASVPPPTSNGPLWQSAGGGFTPATGSVAANVPCRFVSLSLKLDQAAPEPAPPKLIGETSTCPRSSSYIGYLRSTLFVEGLDAHGARLFVATGTNPMHQDLEVPPPQGGGQFSWHAVDTKMSSITTLIQAPLTPALSKLRWFDVDEKLQPHELGESVWPGN